MSTMLSNVLVKFYIIYKKITLGHIKFGKIVLFYLFTSNWVSEFSKSRYLLFYILHLQ